MIFQTAVDLEIEDKKVQVIFDLDTGMIGFTDASESKVVEYDYFSSPPEYKIAFAELMEKIASPKHQSNSLICRKGKASQLIQEYWANVKASKS